MDESRKDHLRLLESTHEWPGAYLFKFVIPAPHREQLLLLMGDHSVQFENISRTGKYLSLTIEKTFTAAAEVLDIYAKVRVIRGIVCL